MTKKLNELKEYQETRNNSDDSDFMLTITFNLLSNLGDRTNFMHEQLERYRIENKEVDKNLKIIAGLYVCSLVTCWETLFRDLFIFISNYDSEINQRLRTSSNSEIPQEFTIGEFYSRKYNFQNLQQTKQAFDDIFQKQTTEISDYFTEDVFNGLMFVQYAMIFKWIQQGNFKEKVDNTLKEAFRIRHRCTHDANYLIDFDSTLLSEIECVFQMIPQFFISHYAEVYSQKRIVFNKDERYIRVTDNPNQNELRYAMNVRDFMATDWNVVD